MEPAILASRFPPEGQRGMGLHSASLPTGLTIVFEEYFNTTQLHKPILIRANRKGIEGVNNIDSIAAGAEVDGIFLRSICLVTLIGKPGSIFHQKEFS